MLQIPGQASSIQLFTFHFRTLLLSQFPGSVECIRTDNEAEPSEMLREYLFSFGLHCPMSFYCFFLYLVISYYQKENGNLKWQKL